MYNAEPPSGTPLDDDWPGDKVLEILAEMAVPLFIFAATICRFVGDRRWDPKKRLAAILKHPASQASKLDRTYLPILDQLLVGQSELEMEKLATEFREVVGAIIVLASPLSIRSLASLLIIPEDDVACRLDLLQSVLSIPTNKAHPVRLLHLSFRDFLLDNQKREKSPFWVDERMMHGRMVSKCLQRISKCLRKDICNLKRPGILRTEIHHEFIDACLSADVQYGCSYWVNHLEQSNCGISDNDQVHIFLKAHFLHWLEVLSLLGKVSESVGMIKILQGLLKVGCSRYLEGVCVDCDLAYNKCRAFRISP